MSGTTGTSTTSPTACWVDAAGIHAPPFSQILAYLQSQYQGIYGSDVVLSNDTQDGQWIAIIATAINDANNAAIAAYGNFSPQTSQGNGLANMVKINGLTKGVASNSTLPVAIGGTYLTFIPAGIITDNNGNNWNLPPGVTIPSAGVITVTATAQNAGAINAEPQTFKISTPIGGWQTAISATAAIPGEPIESDGALRIRQAQSVEINEETATQSLRAQLLALTGVGRLNIIDNDTSSMDSNGVPAKSIAVVIEGGSSSAIGNAIRTSKTFGAGTFGTISVPYTDPFGNAQNVNYSAPTEVTITVAITVLASTIPGGGYTTLIGQQIAAAVAAYISALPIGGDVYLNRVMLPANLYGGVGSSTFDVVSIELSRTGSGGLAASNVTIAYNEAPFCPLDPTSGLPTTITITPT
jgi:uncharacterized phage protein gp47/JayE